MADDLLAPAALAELAQLAEEAARAAGAVLLDGLGQHRDSVTTKSSLTDMVSEMDRAAEAIIVELLLAARPDDAILAEEGSNRAGRSDVRWVIDPLDGTTNYLYGHPRWSVSIGAEVHGQVAVGVVADPSVDELFTATLGGGAFCNGQPIRHSGKDGLATALIGTGFSYIRERRAEQAALLSSVLPVVRDIRRSGVASLDLCWVACGRLDGYYEIGLQPWDVAAGGLIAAEAGAAVSGAHGGPPSGASVLAAAPRLAPALLQLIAAAGA